MHKFRLIKSCQPTDAISEYLRLRERVAIFLKTVANIEPFISRVYCNIEVGFKKPLQLPIYYEDK